jgi:type IV pilus assembly protein PilA
MHRLRSPKRLLNAFTILELLVVLIVIAILIAIAFPVFGTMLTKARQASVDSDARSAALEVATAAEDDANANLASLLAGVAGKYTDSANFSVDGTAGGFRVTNQHQRDTSVTGSYTVGDYTSGDDTPYGVDMRTLPTGSYDPTLGASVTVEFPLDEGWSEIQLMVTGIPDAGNPGPSSFEQKYYVHSDVNTDQVGGWLPYEDGWLGQVVPAPEGEGEVVRFYQNREPGYTYLYHMYVYYQRDYEVTGPPQGGWIYVSTGDCVTSQSGFGLPAELVCD